MSKSHSQKASCTTSINASSLRFFSVTKKGIYPPSLSFGIKRYIVPSLVSKRRNRVPQRYVVRSLLCTPFSAFTFLDTDTSISISCSLSHCIIAYSGSGFGNKIQYLVFKERAILGSGYWLSPLCLWYKPHFWASNDLFQLPNCELDYTLFDWVCWILILTFS